MPKLCTFEGCDRPCGGGARICYGHQYQKYKSKNPMRPIVGHRRPLLERIWEQVEKTPTCWLWKGGSVDKDGYGLISILDRNFRVTRALWVEIHGPIEPGLIVCHKCDVPACVNPDHLFLGTVGDNAKDMVQKGRSRAGERNNGAKFTAHDVIDMRTLHAFGAVPVAIRAAFGVSKTQLRRILDRESWRGV